MKDFGESYEELERQRREDRIIDTVCNVAMVTFGCISMGFVVYIFSEFVVQLVTG